MHANEALWRHVGEAPADLDAPDVASLRCVGLFDAAWEAWGLR
ncbi:MAG: hypothetical protein AAF602_09425 [Myxococcota bacterium]